jgi:hypothetical protein
MTDWPTNQPTNPTQPNPNLLNKPQPNPTQTQTESNPKQTESNPQPKPNPNTNPKPNQPINQLHEVSPGWKANSSSASPLIHNI